VGNESAQKLPFVDFFCLHKNTLADCMFFVGHIAMSNVSLLMQPFFFYQGPIELSFALLSVLATNHGRITIIYLCLI